MENFIPQSNAYIQENINEGHIGQMGMAMNQQEIMNQGMNQNMQMQQINQMEQAQIESKKNNKKNIIFFIIIKEEEDAQKMTQKADFIHANAANLT